MTSKTSGDHAFLLGFAAGMRSMMPPAAIAWAQHMGGLSLPRPFCYAGTRPGVALLTLAAGGELVADKLPFTPSRLAPGGLVVRAATGALSGACVYAAANQPAWRGVVPGALGGLAGSYAGYEARSRLTAASVDAAGRRGIGAGIARFAVAVAEDVACIALCFSVLHRASHKRLARD